MTPLIFRKDASSTLDFALDWSTWLVDGDTVITATWDVPAGISQPSGKPSIIGAGGLKTVIWLSGGTAGEMYPLVCNVTTAQGRSNSREVEMRIRPAT